MSAPVRTRRTARTDGHAPWVPPPRGPRRAAPGRHRLHDDPAMPRREEARHESTAEIPAVDRARDGLSVRALPRPDTAGQVIQHPVTGALAVACNSPGTSVPPAFTRPIYAMVTGHDQHGGHYWLTYGEVIDGGWELAGDIHNALIRP